MLFVCIRVAPSGLIQQLRGSNSNACKVDQNWSSKRVAYQAQVDFFLCSESNSSIWSFIFYSSPSSRYHEKGTQTKTAHRIRNCWKCPYSRCLSQLLSNIIQALSCKTCDVELNDYEFLALYIHVCRFLFLVIQMKFFIIFFSVKSIQWEWLTRLA